MDYYLSDEVKSLKDWKPQLGEKYWFVAWELSFPKSREEKEESFALREVRKDVYGVAAYAKNSTRYFPLLSESKFKKVLGVKNEYTNLSDIKDIDKVIPAGTQLYYNDKSKYSTSRAGELSHTFWTTSNVYAVRYTSGGWDKVEVLKVKTKDIKQMKYEDKWHLNDGKTTIPADADTLCKDGSVVAYRLPIKEPKVGDMVRVDNEGWEYKLLYIHQEDYRKWAVVAYEGDIPMSYKFEDIRLVD